MSRSHEFSSTAPVSQWVLLSHASEAARGGLLDDLLDLEKNFPATYYEGLIQYCDIESKPGRKSKDDSSTKAFDYTALLQSRWAV